ncbi:DUF2637 domain-containing protein [Parafrankia sp. FMc6]|uniref:DUF2637 domain-containing protein n=1 Tax=Parafrankia soli TaxID=2599596 RepID=UPI0034D4EB91
MSADTITLDRLLRIRRGLRAVLILPVGATVAGNVLHAQPTLVGRIISAWAPVALLIAVEILTRTPASTTRSRRVPLRAAVLAVTGVAAWVSYGHLYAVCARYGEDAVSARILPLSVDGLIVVITVKLVEINARIRDLEATRAADLPTPAHAGQTA